MKKVMNVTILVSIFLTIIKSNMQGKAVDLFQLIAIILISMLIGIVAVMANEMHQLDKENSEDFLTPKSKKYD